jgi:hypothetical protein
MECRWKIVKLGEGDQKQFRPDEFPRTFKGVGSLTIGRIPGPYRTYIATLEAFHGNILALYQNITTAVC